MKNEKVDYTGVYIVKINKLEKEIERLNNIIDILEKDIKEAIEELKPNELVDGKILLNNILKEIKELKDKE